jgi:hypothetical protein
MLVDIIREVFGNQLLIRFLFQEILIEGWRMLFEVFNDKRPNWIDFTFLHQHEQELSVTGIHKGQPLGCFTLFFTPPYTFFTKFIFADVDVVIRTGVTNVNSWLLDFC